VDAGSPQRSAQQALSIVISGGALPGAFGKTAPADGAMKLSQSLALTWGASSGATSYEYCIDTSNDNACSTSWVPATSGVVVSGLAKNAWLYWQVRAVNASGSTLANGGTWWRFRTR
jgi:hypothetical protein